MPELHADTGGTVPLRVSGGGDVPLRVSGDAQLPLTAGEVTDSGLRYAEVSNEHGITITIG
jgi:hypothetical protein